MNAPLLLIVLIPLIFFFITWYRFHWGLFLLFLLLPGYLVRFHIGWLPTTLLEIFVLIICTVFVIKNIGNFKSSTYYLLPIIQSNKLLVLGICLFLIAATLSIFTSVDLQSAAGEWKAFYVEPVLLSLVLIMYFGNRSIDQKGLVVQWLIFAFLLCGLITSLLAMYQHFTGWMVPHAFWANGNSYRVTAWYGFPNAVGLFLAPLVPLAIYNFIKAFSDMREKRSMNHELKIMDYLRTLLPIFMLPASLFAIFFAKSTGGLIGTAAGTGVLLLCRKKTRWPAIAAGVLSLIAVLTIPALTPIKTEVFARDRSGQIRRAIWSETFELLKERPLLGAGLASYSERIAPYHKSVNAERIEIFHHPHNIFLTMWVNLGLLGLFGFILILTWFYKTLLNQESCIKNEGKNPLFMIHDSLFFVSSMTALLVTGLVDSPYIKNDLSIFFWFLLAAAVLCTKKDNCILS